jgi:predicted metal-dependent hydrolase
MPTWGIKIMKTKWGSCTVAARRIWLNLELSKKPPQCIEYIVAHEMMHFLERNHTERFAALMDRHLPNWKTLRDELSHAPLGHTGWERCREGEE